MTLIQGIGYDSDDVKATLGATRYAALIATLKNKSVFACGHRKDANNVEIVCIYKADYDKFIASGG